MSLTGFLSYSRVNWQQSPSKSTPLSAANLNVMYPDGSYVPHTWLLDCWTPAGMLSMNLTDSVTIRGNLWEEWHIAPAKQR